VLGSDPQAPAPSTLSLVVVACSNEVKIGAVISESGAVASYGNEVKRGLELALAEIAAEGGVDGNQITLVYRDDSTNPDMGQKAVEELMAEDVDLMIGAVSSPVTLRIAPICEEKQVVLLSPSASAPQISQMGEYIFRNYPSDILEGTSMAKFAKEAGLERVVIFTLENEFGAGLTDVFTKEYESKFRHVVATFEFSPGKSSGFEAIVAEAAAADPDGVYIISYDAELAALLQAIHDSEMDVVTLGTSSVPVDIGQLAGPAGEHLIYPQSSFNPSSNDPVVSKFVQAYRGKYGADPGIYAAQGYDALMLFAEAIRNAGSSHPANVKFGMGQINDFHGAAGVTAFDKNGDVVRYPRLFIINNGLPMPYDQFTEEGLSIFNRGS
jgi:branched-chain amino acid transport system substrate-binding protein